MKDLTIVKAYANNKRKKLIANSLMREDLKAEIIGFINHIENRFEGGYMSIDEAMGNIACAESTVCN